MPANLNRILGGLAALQLCLLGGCDATSLIAMSEGRTSAPQETVDSTEPPASLSPAEWLQEIEKAAADADQVAKLLDSGGNRQLRMKEFAESIQRGAAAAEAIAAHPQASAGEKDTAGTRRVHLLYVGARQDPEAFLDALRGDVEARLAKAPDSEAAVLGEALLLELTVVRSDAPHDEKMKTLAEFAARREYAPASLLLYLQYGELLEQAEDVKATVACYQQVIESFPDSPRIEAVRRRLSTILAAYQRLVAEQAATNARIARIKSLLGREDGYFVIYSRERDKSTYRFSYDVVRADSVVARVMRLPADWKWEVSGWFEDSAAGLAAASQLRHKLSQQGILIPSWN